MFPELTAVPAYVADDKNGGSVPFIISLRLFDQEGNARITPAVESSINKTVDITGREGIAHGVMSSASDIENKAEAYVRRAMTIAGAIVLFRCDTPELCEQLMTHLSSRFSLSLLQENSAP
ncbi:hypothetical protein J4H94_20900 (plasmid) [Stutzerimonas frequens]|nr:hypothetical protein [Pseudomonas mendocina]QTF59152.1 hypothetical protein J4H94_20900 [Stutzerimonas frequens]